MPEGSIASDEVLYRRIPPGKDWFEPPDRISSMNFKLRPGEMGISVYRAGIVSIQGVLCKPNAIPGSGVAQAVKGDICAALDGNEEPLGLDVLPVNDENDPGHAEIRGRSIQERPKVVAKALKKLFQVAAPPAVR